MREGPFKIAAEHASSGSDQRTTAPETAARALRGFPRALCPRRSHSAFRPEPRTATCHPPLVPPGTSGVRYSHKYGPRVTASSRHSASAVLRTGCAVSGCAGAPGPLLAPPQPPQEQPCCCRVPLATSPPVSSPSFPAAAAQGEFLPCNQSAPCAQRCVLSCRPHAVYGVNAWGHVLLADLLQKVPGIGTKS